MIPHPLLPSSIPAKPTPILVADASHEHRMLLSVDHLELNMS
jgi:hypothetical protein